MAVEIVTGTEFPIASPEFQQRVDSNVFNWRKNLK